MSIQQDVDLLHNAAMSFGSEWPVGWDATAAYHRIKAHLADEERGHTRTIEQRDSHHDTADRLTDAIAKHFGQDFGEHSSANNPWANALDFLENLP